MSFDDLFALAPLAAPAVTALVVLLVLCVRRSHRLVATLSGLGLAFGLALLPAAWLAPAAKVGEMLVLDRLAVVFTGMLLAMALATVLLAAGYLERQKERREEFYVFLLLATTGAVTLTAAANLVSFFLGLEVLSVSLYVLIAYQRERRVRLEAGIKYLVLGGVSTSFMLLGMAFVYAKVGSMSFGPVGEAMGWIPLRNHLPALMGFGLIIVGVGFKLALVPMHLWAADVYQGAPAPVAMFIATVSKGAVFVAALRLFGNVAHPYDDSWRLAFTVLAVASMFGGNLLALRQENLKRLLAYSSIAQVGYLLVALVAAGTASQAAGLYLAAYFATSVLAWGVLIVLSPGEEDAQALGDLRGLAWRRPRLTALLTLALISLAGLPLTGGFLGKFLLLEEGVGERLWVLVGALVLSSVVGLFYYLRVIAALFSRAEDVLSPPAPPVPVAAKVALVVALVVLLVLGLFPAPFLGLLRAVGEWRGF
ncbi:MAG TPA: NADH-quinone oxidoreductase subunit N [Armatimonadota bacterium]|jgi:NADH-quinone oxidoreductase subunit N